ncbi:MAG: nucleotide exchange factor GrpE, partial [Gammaproteobacteria bacterium]
MADEEILEQNQAVEAEDTPAETAEAGSPGDDLSVDELKARLADAEKKAADNWDLFLRTKAEMENQRRRAQRDLENAHKYALEKFVAELLPVKDSLELGLQAVEQGTGDIDSLRQGTELTLN